MAGIDFRGQLDQLARALITNEDLQRAERVERGLDNQGNPVLEGRDFIPLRDENGDVWRIRINSSGTIRATKVTTP